MLLLLGSPYGCHLLTNVAAATAAAYLATGIPDFRGKAGVWTLEKQGQPLPDYEKCWDNAMPTLGHMALVGLAKEGLVHGVISQNVDGERQAGWERKRTVSFWVAVLIYGMYIPVFRTCQCCFFGPS